MLEIVDVFITSKWFGATGWIIGLASLIATIVFAAVQRRTKLPMVSCDQRIIFDEASSPHKDLQIMFRGKGVPNLAFTTIMFWNDGKEPIRREDISGHDALRVIVPANTLLLNIEAADLTGPSTGFAATNNDPNVIKVTFEHLDRGQAGQVTILHTFVKGSRFEVAGTIIGGRRLADAKMRGVRRDLFINVTLVVLLSALIYITMFSREPQNNYVIGTLGVLGGALLAWGVVAGSAAGPRLARERKRTLFEWFRENF